MASQYKFGKLDPVYLLWHRIFYKWMPYWGKVIVISKNLQRHFDALSCSTFYLPPLIDSEESGLGEVCEMVTQLNLSMLVRFLRKMHLIAC